MAPSPATLTKSRADGGAEVVASAAAVFGVLDLLEEIATAPETRDRTHRVRRSAEAALRESGLTYGDIDDSAERCHGGIGRHGPKRVPHGTADPRRSPDYDLGELLPFPDPSR
jgi:hypothetical protein